MKTFRTHENKIVKGKELTKALNTVADDLIESAYAIRKGDAYASHVTEADKDLYLKEGIERAERVRRGEEWGFWVWQRVNTVLTGECVALLSK